jgi:predicted GNAT family acetyltransferase
MHRIIELSDATTFLERSRDFLLASEAENNLLLSSAWTMARNSMTRSPRLSFFTVERRHNLECAALNSSERRLLLSTCTIEAAEALAREFAHREIKIKGVLGPGPSASAFARAYCAEAGHPLTPRFLQNILRLESPEPHDPAPGLLVAAKEKHFKLLLSWSLSFVAECGLQEPQHETEELVRRYIESRRFFIWEDRQPVAMAGFGGVTPNGVRVNMVYTEPRFRGRGYAGTLVHTLSRKLLADGHRFCYLFADSVNPAASRIYERLGYERVCDFTEFR